MILYSYYIKAGSRVPTSPQGVMMRPVHCFISFFFIQCFFLFNFLFFIFVFEFQQGQAVPQMQSNATPSPVPSPQR